MIYYISDLHLGDKRVFDLCGRNKTINEYNNELIEKWNSKVTNKDSVYILGDFAHENYSYEALEVIDELNGIKNLIVGNHDEFILLEVGEREITRHFNTIAWSELIVDNGRVVHLSHYPMMDWNMSQRGSYHVYGHIHNKNLPDIKNYYKDKLAFNASADVIGHIPMSLDELIKIKEEQ